MQNSKLRVNRSLLLHSASGSISAALADGPCAKGLLELQAEHEGKFVTQAVFERGLRDKADSAGVYSKDACDKKFPTKEVMKKALSKKAETHEVYSRTEADAKFVTEVDFQAALAMKANDSAVYAKGEADGKICLEN